MLVGTCLWHVRQLWVVTNAILLNEARKLFRATFSEDFRNKNVID